MTINPQISLEIARQRGADLARVSAQGRGPAEHVAASSKPSVRWQSVKRARRHLIPAGADKR